MFFNIVNVSFPYSASEPAQDIGKLGKHLPIATL